MENKKIQFINLSRQYLSISNELDKAIQSVLSSGHFILGPNVEKFEEEIAQFCNCNYAIGVASGTDALLLALMALGISKGDEVITTPFTFVATANTIVRVGATPVFADIEEGSFNIDPEQIESKITPKTKGIIPVHLFGNPANLSKISELARKYNLFIVEDAAQAIGSKIKDVPIGGFGIVSALSFFPSKNLGAYGDAGAVLTNDADIKLMVDCFRRQGAKKKYYHEFLGINSRLDELHASILRVKLRHLMAWNSRRREIAHYYNQTLGGKGFILPQESLDSYHVYHQYTIRLKEKRNQLVSFLADRGIETMIYYPFPLHLQPLFHELGYGVGDFPIAEMICDQVISLPCYPELSREEQEVICEALLTF